MSRNLPLKHVYGYTPKPSRDAKQARKVHVKKPVPPSFSDTYYPNSTRA
ncbi:MAG: hypothetical protein ACRC4G_03220 [Alphaproteobacteria bacterium]